eukprot:8215274-Pyramimonas_sp.AAC.1
MALPREDGDGDETVCVLKHPCSPHREMEVSTVLRSTSSASHLDRASGVFEDQARMIARQLVDERNKQ